MDEILYLEPDEEITSVIDKLRQVSGRRVSLVVPRGATILQSVINLKLLAKEANNLQKEIAIVTGDRIGRNLAAQVGLVVYESLKNPRPIYDPNAPVIAKEEVLEIDGSSEQKAANTGLNVHHFQQENVPKQIAQPELADSAPVKFTPQASFSPAKKIKPQRSINWAPLRKIALPGIIIILLLVLTGSYFIFPKVNVAIKVTAENFQKTGDFNVSGDLSNADPSVFTGTFVEVSKEKEEKFSATGKKNLGGKAAGSITLYNNLDSSTHALAAGTKLSSSSKTFILKKAVTVPGATVQNLKIVPGTTNADIEAENPGDEYNVAAGRFTIIELPASAQEAIYGQSTKALSGGFSKEVQVVSQEDYDKGKAKMEAELSDLITQEIQKQTTDLVILDKALKIEQSDLKTSANVNDQASDFTMKLAERGRVISFSEKNFKEFIIKQMSDQIPAEKMISLGPEDKISPVVKETNYDQKTLVLTVAMTAKISTKLNTEQIKADLYGKNQTGANNLLGSLSGIESYEMTFSPSWWPIKKIPKYGNGLKIGLEYVQKETEAQP